MIPAETSRDTLLIVLVVFKKKSIFKCCDIIYDNN